MSMCLQFTIITFLLSWGVDTLPSLGQAEGLRDNQWLNSIQSIIRLVLGSTWSGVTANHDQAGTKHTGLKCPYSNSVRAGNVIALPFW